MSKDVIKDFRLLSRQEAERQTKPMRDIVNAIFSEGKCTKMKEQWEVEIWESERGYGQKYYMSKFFDTYSEAKDFYDNEYAKNDSRTVPEWYTFPRTPTKKVIA